MNHVRFTKLVVFLGMLALLWIPVEYAAAAQLAVNALWLWKL